MLGCVQLLASSDSAPDFTHSRRLSLAARNAERPLILALGSTGASAATTRWRIAALPHNGWHVTLEKLRLAYDTPPPTGGWAVYPHHIDAQAQNTTAYYAAYAARCLGSFHVCAAPPSHKSLC